jgi:curved DNA-binding protein
MIFMQPPSVAAYSMPAQFLDYYQTLGVSKSASQDEIKSAFRKLARKHHPDVAADKKAAEEKFKQINEAYEVLGDPEKRRKYDEFGAGWQAGGGVPPGGAGGGPDFARDFGNVEFEFGGTGFSDFFEQLFGTRRSGRTGFGGGFAGAGREAPERGQDIESDILVTIEEALHGSTRRISFRRGTTGKLETYTVRIPRGVREGQRIRLAGVGGAGGGGGASGDLFLRVRYERHPEFDVDGADLIHEAEVPAWVAVLGGEVSVATPDGRARLKIPAGAQAGQRFRLAGKGLPTTGSTHERGDLFVVLGVVLPSPPFTPEETEAWQRVATLHSGR